MKRKRENVNLYKFTLETNSPCFSNESSPYDRDSNRVVPEEERELFFLVDHYGRGALNQLAVDLVHRMLWERNMAKEYAEVNRVGPTHPAFGRAKYRIRFCGYHGRESRAVFISTDEAENGIKAHVCSMNSCVRCGTIGATFLLTPNSEITRCGGCFRLPGVKTPG